MDPIDHSEALAAVEVFYKNQIERMESNKSHWQSEIDANQQLIDRDAEFLAKMKFKLASIRSLQATIRPSAVMQ